MCPSAKLTVCLYLFIPQSNIILFINILYHS